ncbi:polysaccharide deacetylase [Thermosporothrix hazakensis]|uniref:Polysaccharide deacetylase n=2 Tax=Thermosporothrix TaxID=768650 RepID=A0A326UBI5_THEHA|nr:polysaccharide deacetylase family protein [Thermosporothrix hazakensis]PZW35962.1 polysaccharide deacetylase [Thermosporothrix hazakensis]
MNLVSFSIKTKGMHNFIRRLWTVFARFGFTEGRTRRSLYSIMDALSSYKGSPTFFIPAIVLQRHPRLIAELAENGAEIGIHGYIHNDYRALNRDEQYHHVRRAIEVFESVPLVFQGFRNPYLGWTEETLDVFTELDLTYDSNEAVIHDVIDRSRFTPTLLDGLEKSLALFQAIPPGTYALRPHFEGNLLRIPTSIPDDEMLFDRLRVTNAHELGEIWCRVMQNVYDYGGIYALNLHPERGVLCRRPLDMLLRYAAELPGGVWLARLDEVAQWWRERSRFSIQITPRGSHFWQIEATCTPRATLRARNISVDYQLPTVGRELTCKPRCIVQSSKCPCIGLSLRTPRSVSHFLQEEGYPTHYCAQEQAEQYALYLDMPEGMGASRHELRSIGCELIQRIEQSDAPLLYFGAWPNNCRAALAISGDIDSITIQDFFLRILEVHQQKRVHEQSAV